MTRGGAHPRFHSHTHPQKRPIEYLSAVTPSFPFPHPLPSGDPSNIRVPSPSPFPHPLPRSDPSNIRVPSPSPLPHPLPSSDPSNIRPPSCPRFHSHTPPQKRPIEHPMAVAVPIPTPPPHIGSVRALLLRHSPPNSVSRKLRREYFNSICNSEKTQFLEDSVSQVLEHRISAQALVNTAFRDAGSLKGNG